MSEGPLCDPEDKTEYAITFRNLATGEERVGHLIAGFDQTGEHYRIDVNVPDLLAQGFEDRDWFECLIGLRKVLEPMGWRPMCNGARTDAFPSGMARDMGGAARLYVMELGKHVTRDDLVDIFEPCEADLVGTVEEQHAYWRRWLESPKPPWEPPSRGD